MKLNVSFRFSPNRVVPVGTLYQNGRDSAFEYAKSFFAEKLNPAPFRLPVKDGVNVFDWSGGMETFGMFEDSLPDGWGRRLVDVMFRKRKGRLPTVLERLACVGSTGMGALAYEPEDSPALQYTEFDLAAVASDAMTHQAVGHAGHSHGVTHPGATNNDRGHGTVDKRLLANLQ